MNLIEYVDGARIVTPERPLVPPIRSSDWEEPQDDDMYDLASGLLKLDAHRLPERAGDIRACLDVLTDLLATDMAPVRCGQWLAAEDALHARCSICEGTGNWSDFCPSCGAKMNSKRKRPDHERAV